MHRLIHPVVLFFQLKKLIDALERQLEAATETERQLHSQLHDIQIVDRFLLDFCPQPRSESETLIYFMPKMRLLTDLDKRLYS